MLIFNDLSMTFHDLCYFPDFSRPAVTLSKIQQFKMHLSEMVIELNVVNVTK